jgi:hypothetical protein
MNISYPADQVHNPAQILRKAGYQYFVDPVTKKESWIIRLTSGYYPRFHLYAEQSGSAISFNLHLDQKKPSYKGTRAHGGEYDGPAVEKEIKRIADWIAAETGVRNTSENDNNANQAPQTPKTLKTESNQKSDDLFGGIF